MPSYNSAQKRQDKLYSENASSPGIQDSKRTYVTITESMPILSMLPVYLKEASAYLQLHNQLYFPSNLILIFWLF